MTFIQYLSDKSQEAFKVTSSNGDGFEMVRYLLHGDKMSGGAECYS